MSSKSQNAVIDHIKQILSGNFAKVNEYIITKLRSDINQVEEIGSYIINAGGKRIRPMLTLLVAAACDYFDDKHLKLAAVIEFLHTATLLHDDVVDTSSMRRGRPTANDCWGNSASVLVGDFLYSRAFQTMVEIESLSVMDVLANATNQIAEGEVQQLTLIKNTEISEAVYYEIIYRKTAKLFEAASHSVSVLITENKTMSKSYAEMLVENMKAFGKHIGLAFQLKDDLLDYVGNFHEIGKNCGDDLAEGKLTLPLIHSLEHASEVEKMLIVGAIHDGNRDQLHHIREILERYDSLKYTAEQAEQQISHAKNCLEMLEPSIYRDSLHELSDFAHVRVA